MSLSMLLLIVCTVLVAARMEECQAVVTAPGYVIYSTYMGDSCTDSDIIGNAAGNCSIISYLNSLY